MAPGLSIAKLPPHLQRHTITASVPELTPIAAALEGRSVVLDGELVAFQDGRCHDCTS